MKFLNKKALIGTDLSACGNKKAFLNKLKKIFFFSIFLLEIYFSSPYFMELELLIKVVYIYIIKLDPSLFLL